MMVLRHLSWHKVLLFWQFSQALRTSWGSHAFCHIKHCWILLESPWQYPSHEFLFLCTKLDPLGRSLGLGFKTQKRDQIILTTTLKSLMVCKEAYFQVLCCYTASYLPVRKQPSFWIPISYIYLWSSLLPSFFVVRVFCSSSVHEAQLQPQNELLKG